ncbi:MAG: ABC transporter permease subunit [Ktedonobacteraceae bacterium]|nr:ABC transporter permease subunit [Ktedonobacteraceae bacterium]
MNTTPPFVPEAQTSTQGYISTIIMGRQDFLSVLFRSISGELYKIWRRRLSKVLLTIGLLIMMLGFVAVALPPIIVYNSPSSIFLPPSCSSLSQAGGTVAPGSCLDHPPTQQDLAKAEQMKQEAVRSSAASLYLPGSFITAGQIVNFIGLLLLVILAGTIVGGEYSVGTIRLLLTRGPTRTQFFLAKLGAILVSIGITFLILMPIGIAMGALFELAIPGIAVNFSFFTGTWMLHAALYLLESILGLLMYTMIALCFSFLGRATAAGVAGAIVWWVLENILSTILSLLAATNKGVFADILKAIPDYFIGTNISALLGNQTSYLIGGQPSSISDLHAVLVLAVYLVIFIGSAWIVHLRRDVTN